MSRLEAGLNRRKFLFRVFGRYLAALALLAQLTAPAGLASRPGPDVAGFLCAPPGTLSPAAVAEAEALLADLLGQQPDDESGTAHCPFCVLVHGLPLPDCHPTPVITLVPLDVSARPFETAFVHQPQGPPLGLRAPPATSL